MVKGVDILHIMGIVSFLNLSLWLAILLHSRWCIGIRWNPDLFAFLPWIYYTLKISWTNITKVWKLSSTRMNVNRILWRWKVQSGLIKSLSMWIQFPQPSRHPVSDKRAASLCLPLSKLQLGGGCMLACQSITVKAHVLKMMTVAIYTDSNAFGVSCLEQ